MTRLPILAALLLLAAPAAAQDASPRAMALHIFDKADLNRDEMLSAEEHSGAGLGRFGVTFDQIDADGDGLVTRTEYLSMFEKHHRPVGERNV